MTHNMNEFSLQQAKDVYSRTLFSAFFEKFILREGEGGGPDRAGFPSVLIYKDCLYFEGSQSYKNKMSLFVRFVLILDPSLFYPLFCPYICDFEKFIQKMTNFLKKKV